MKTVLSVLFLTLIASIGLAAEPLRIGTFDVDASPPIGSTGMSLMPEGLEKQIDQGAMADVIAYLMSLK